MDVRNQNKVNGNYYHYQPIIEVNINFNCNHQASEPVSNKDSKASIIPWLLNQFPKIWPYIKKLVTIALLFLGIDSS
jgi:hypothetical protein